MKNKILPNEQSFPTLDTSSKHLPGEIWKDIPGFEDEYQLSSYGRLKSQDRWVNYKRCDAFRPGRIRKLGLTYSAKKGNGSFIDLQMKLHKEGKRYYYSVARFVYYMFIARFDLEDHTLIVTRRDGNSKNCHFENLLLRSLSEVALEGFVTEKRKSIFQLQVKPVSQYSLEGRFIEQYANAKEASEATGILQAYISGAACSKHRTGGGYFWRYGNIKSHIKTADYKKQLDNSNITSIIESHGKKRHHYLNRVVNNLAGEKWKDISGFEGLYQVSDFGRIKSIPRPREVRTKNGNTACHWTRDLIMKQTVVNILNQTTGSSYSYLTIRIKKNGVYTSYVVSRLVNQEFGRKKEGSENCKIIHKDGDNLNNHIDNLEAVTQSEILKKSYKENRRISHFSRPGTK